MAKVNTATANKDYPSEGIKKGDLYYWWSFKFGGKHRSKNPPKPSQLTRSEFHKARLELAERIENLDADTLEALEADIVDIIDNLKTLAEETREKYDNLPENFQSGEQGTLLEERAEKMDEAAGELEGLDYDWDEEAAKEDVDDELTTDEGDDKPTDEEKAEALDEKKAERIREVIEEAQAVDLEVD